MKFVLDSSVGLKIVLIENDSELAEALIDDFKNQIHELIAPDCYLAECANILTKAERKKIILPQEAIKKFQIIMDFCPNLFPHVPLIPRAVNISSSVVHGVYDCLLIALGEQEGCQVVTADERFAKKFPNDVILLANL